MRRFLSILFLSLALPAATFAQFRSDALGDGESETSSALREHVGFLSAMALEGRAAGSEGEKEAAEYIYDKLSSYGVEMLCSRSGETFGISRTPGDTLASRNVLGFVQGYDPVLRNRYIVIGARLDNIGVNKMTIDGVPHEQVFPGANGNASGLAMMTELARMLSVNSLLLRRSVIFIAFGASREGQAGSWYFLNRSFPDVDKIDAMVNLDMLGAGEDFYAFDVSNRDMDAMIASVELSPVRPVVTTIEPFPSDHRSFWSAGIPSVFFTRGFYPEHDSPRDKASILDFDMMERELEYIYGFVRTLSVADNAPRFNPPADSDNGDGKVWSYDAVDAKPSFMGSYDLRVFMEKWVYQYLKYPPEAVDAGQQGTVNVQFTIDRKGKVRDAKVLRSAGELLDAEALKVINASPGWKPAKAGGKAVACRVRVPVEFKLTDKSKFGIKR
ncbi:MAG: TonB family protein [Bacteroidales bacterium]|nr:TonB family protein [Bacteroidales bacterium]